MYDTPPPHPQNKKYIYFQIYESWIQSWLCALKMNVYIAENDAYSWPI